MARFLELLLVSALAGCAGHNTHESTFVVAGGNEGSLNNVTVLADPTFTAPTLEVGLEQVERPTATAIGRLSKPANSAMGALPGVQKLARRPVVAITEYRNWLWFATDVTVDGTTKAVTALTGGLTVQKGGTNVLKWGETGQ